MSHFGKVEWKLLPYLQIFHPSCLSTCTYIRHNMMEEWTCTVRPHALTMWVANTQNQCGFPPMLKTTNNDVKTSHFLKLTFKAIIQNYYLVISVIATVLNCYVAVPGKIH